MIQIITAPEKVDIKKTGKGVICISVREECVLEIFLASSDLSMVNEIQNALYDERAKELGLEE